MWQKGTPLCLPTLLHMFKCGRRVTLLPTVLRHSKGTTVPGGATDLGSLFLHYHLWLVTPGGVAAGKDISLLSGLLEHLVRVWFSSQEARGPSVSLSEAAQGSQGLMFTTLSSRATQLHALCHHSYIQSQNLLPWNVSTLPLISHPEGKVWRPGRR